MQSVRTLHCDLHFERPCACGSEAIRDGGRSGLHEMHGLRQRLPNDALYFGFGKPALLAPKSTAIKRSYSLTWPEEIVAHWFSWEVSWLCAGFMR